MEQQNKKKPFTLRNLIESEKSWYLEHYGRLDWQWRDEGIAYAILDYHSSVGSVLDFTEDDRKVLKEYGWTMTEAADLCESAEAE